MGNRRNDIEFMRALRASGFSNAVCESINDIRKAIFENSWGLEEPNNEKDVEVSYPNCGETSYHRDGDKTGICPGCGTPISIEQNRSDSDYPDEDWRDENTKYELINQGERADAFLRYDGHNLHRIRALKNITLEDGYVVEAGSLGGYVESEENLSTGGNCWIMNNAKVYGGATVVGNAIVRDHAEVRKGAYVCDHTWIAGGAQVYGEGTWIAGGAKVYGDAKVCCGAKVFRDAEVCGDAYVHGPNKIYGNAYVCDNAKVYAGADVSGTARICGEGQVFEEKVTEGEWQKKYPPEENKKNTWGWGD